MKDISSNSSYGLSVFGVNISDISDNYYFSFISNNSIRSGFTFSTNEIFDVAYSDKYLIYKRGNNYLISDGENNRPNSDWVLLQSFMAESIINLNDGIVVRRHFD